MRFFRKKESRRDSEPTDPTGSATMASIGKKLENYQATQGRASFNGQSSYNVEELSSSPAFTPTAKEPKT